MAHWDGSVRRRAAVARRLPPGYGSRVSDPFPAWFESLEARHRESLTFAEIRKGLQALSSLYVERREKLGKGAALEGAGDAGILRQTVIKAVNAGVNVLLFSDTAAYDPKLGAQVQSILVDEANKDPAFAARIEASYRLIAALKGKLKG